MVLLLSMADSAVQAQTVDQSFDAYDRGEYSLAFKNFRKLADEGDLRSQSMLALMYESGQGVGKDERQAFFWAQKAAERGSRGSQYHLGLMYENGRGVNIDVKQAVFWYRKAADLGDPQAQLAMGHMSFHGRGVSQDDSEAALWYQRASNQGVAMAQNNLATMYSNGQGVFKDAKQATYWFQKAAEQGLAVAQVTLGVRYMYGIGVAKDEREATSWFIKAAEKGEADGQHNLGYAYLTGKGVPKNQRLAFQWYKKAAEQRLPEAQFEVGTLTSIGLGVIKDEQQAVVWYRKSAEQGYAAAQVNLGNVYFEGLGVPVNFERAYYWWLLASSLAEVDTAGAVAAKNGREAVETKLTPEQRVSIQIEARNWKKKTAEQADAIANGDSKIENGWNQTPSGLSRSSEQADATGSGFRVARGAIVTNNHVVDGCRRLNVNGKAAQLRGSDARSDLALLSTTLSGPSTSLRAQRASVGEPVAVAGYPLRGLLSGFNMTLGNLSSLSGIGGDTRLLQITAPVQPGNSGGPLLDSSGNLVGVVVSKLDAIKAAKLTGDIPQNVNFAINANVLRSFLDANSVDYETTSSDKTISSTSIADRARGFTVLIDCWK